MSYNSLQQFDEVYRGFHAAPPAGLHLPLHAGIGVLMGPDVPDAAKTLTPAEIATSAGTIGAVVTDNVTKVRYLLSNSHVFAPPIPKLAGKALALYPIAKATGGTLGSALAGGTLTVNPIIVGRPGRDLLRGAKTQIWNGLYLDAALANPIFNITDYINGIGVPKGHRDPRQGERIRTIGARTGLQTGVVTLADNAETDISVGKDVGNIRRQRGAFQCSVTVSHGDSGSPIVSDDGYVLGIISRAKEVTSNGRTSIAAICVKASTIARAYNVSFVGNGSEYRPPEFLKLLEDYNKRIADPRYKAQLDDVQNQLRAQGIDVDQGRPTPAPAPQRTPTTPVSSPPSKAPVDKLPPSPNIAAGPQTFKIDNNTLLIAGAGLLLLVLVMR